MREELNAMLPHELKYFMQSNGIAGFRGTQLFTHFHKHHNQLIDSVKGFSASLVEELRQLDAPIGQAEILERIQSPFGDTIKYGIRLTDGQMVEAISMIYKSHNTLCLSTQVGCRMGCAFCASTKNGLARNITAGEIVSQFYAAERDLGMPIQNIVLMGIGEPFDNYDEVMRALELLHDPQGRGMSYRNMTISTCGIVPGILRLAKENKPINLAISLHATTDEERTKIMPIANKYSIREIVQACDTYFEETGRRVTYEYTVIPGVNNKPSDVEHLKQIFSRRNAHINLIAYHPIKEYEKSHPNEEQLHAFQKALEKKGLTATVRRSMGLGEDGACGQLRAKMNRKGEEA